MTASLLALLLAPLLASPFDQHPAVELRYTGALAKDTRSGDGTIVKRFSLYANVPNLSKDARQIHYVLEERGAGGWAWPERFGTVALDDGLAVASGALPRLLFDFEGTPNIVPLQSPVFAKADQLQAGARWVEGKESYEVTRTLKVQERNCWQVDVSTNFGRKRTLYIEVDTPLVVAIEERVFVGQGDEHSVTLQLESVKPLDEAQQARVQKPWQQLVKLRSDLQRADNELRPELNETQLKLVAAALPAIEKDAADTALGPLATVINRDLRAQSQRTDEIARLANRYVGQAAPAFGLTLSDKKTVAPADLQGKIVVLHFWEYQGEPLVEPYGQVGYLDFLYSKRRKLGVQVYGVAVDQRFGEPNNSGSAVRSLQKLKSFMNLGYPVTIDDGKLIAKFGDPRRVGGKLPMWVVIAPDGKIAHYQVGFYKINPDEGLRELDDLLIKLIREQKAAEKAAEKKSDE